MNIIETSRLILRHLALGDIEALAAIYADPIVMKFYPSTRSPEETELLRATISKVSGYCPNT